MNANLVHVQQILHLGEYIHPYQKHKEFRGRNAASEKRLGHLQGDRWGQRRKGHPGLFNQGQQRVPSSKLRNRYMVAHRITLCPFLVS